MAAPVVATVIDGVVYGSVQSPKTMRVWPYPTMHATRRFQVYNQQAIALDLAYDGLTGAQQIAWVAARYLRPDQGLCLVPDDYTDNPIYVSTGKSTHRSQNVARFGIGLPYTAAPVLALTVRGDDTGVITDVPPPLSPPSNLSTSVTLDWSRSDAIFGGPWTALIFAGLAKSRPVALQSIRKLKFIGSAPVAPNAPVDVTSVFADGLSCYRGCVIVYRLELMENGVAPFVAFGGFFQN